MLVCRLCTFLCIAIVHVSAIYKDSPGLAFSVEPKDTISRKGLTVHLNCRVTGHSNVVVTWRKDNVRIDVSDRRIILANGTLLLTNVNAGRRTDSSDEGIYQCVASATGVGSIISGKAKLSIIGGQDEAGLPKFEEEPSDLVIYEGERARFPCSVGSDLAVNVSFFHGNRRMDLANSRSTILPSGSLEIESATRSDVGTYHCQVTLGDNRKTSQTALLSVKDSFALRDPVPPSFIAKPRPLTIAALGDIVTLDCAANGYPEPFVTWLKDGATIDMADLDSRFLILGSTQSLQILKVAEEDSGTYMCRAENREDSVDAVAQLQVQVLPRFLEKPSNTMALEKGDVELSCNVYGQPTPSVHWLKNGELIIASEYFQILSGSNLRILGLVEGDSGMYQCVAANAAGEVQAPARLMVHKTDQGWKSKLPPLSNSQTARSGSSEGVLPPPRYVQAVLSSNRFITLSWQEPTASNTAHIAGYSVFYRQDGSMRERIHNVSATLSTEGHDEYKTQISHLTPGTVYAVRVAAFTTDGKLGSASAEITVATKPDLDLPTAPVNLRVFPVSSRSLQVSWDPPNPPPSTPIKGYIMYYMQMGSTEEKEIELVESTFQITDLEEFTEYSVWVLAMNANGVGDSSAEVTGKTYSDIPSGEPLNVTAEAASSKSLILRWEPPAPEHQNGIVVGYKMRYKERGTMGSTTVTSDGNRRLYALTNLKKNSQYSIKLAAVTVNGTGPFTQWFLAETYASDLDESRVPDIPTNLRVTASSGAIQMKWQPPQQQTVIIRGYTVSWGKGIPDVYTEIVDSKQRSYTIERTDPNGEYVISVRAYNNVGHGQQIYEQIRTPPVEEAPAPSLTPPIGLKAEVLTPFTVALQWADASLNRNQYIGDSRYYVVRYSTYSFGTSSNPRYRYINATDVTCLIENLKPSTMYEFAVKTIKGRRESAWSLVASNTTFEARPSSPPRDVTVVTISDESTVVIVNWQPPKFGNGKITGYLLFYTTDPSGDWVLEEVNGDRMTMSVRDLTSSTLYFYKMQARNAKGFGPFSAVGNFTTYEAWTGTGYAEAEIDHDWFVGRGSVIVLIVSGVMGFLVLIGALIGISIYCRSSSHNGGGKPQKIEVKPPDLWIHHDHLELKNLGDNKNLRSGSPSQAGTQITCADYGPEDKAPNYNSSSTLDRRTPYQSTYLRDPLSEDESDKLVNRRSFKPKPLIMSLDVSRNDLMGGSTSSSVYSDGTLGRVGYSRSQFCQPGYSSPVENPYSLNPSSGLNSLMSLGNNQYENALTHPIQPLLYPHSIAPPQYSSIGSDTTDTLGKKSGNPLRSFSVPAPPLLSAPATPQSKHLVPARPQGMCSPVRKTSINDPLNRWGTEAGAVDVMPERDVELSESLLHGYSTEELSQEMANLEGLMKDLSAITANQFNC